MCGSIDNGGACQWTRPGPSFFVLLLRIFVIVGLWHNRRWYQTQSYTKLAQVALPTPSHIGHVFSPCVSGNNSHGKCLTSTTSCPSSPAALRTWWHRFHHKIPTSKKEIKSRLTQIWIKTFSQIIDAHIMFCHVTDMTTKVVPDL